MKTIVVDWSVIKSPADFYIAVLPQTVAPDWHGKNLSAIEDSWVTGDICLGGPPFRFVFRGAEKIDPDFRQFADAIAQIADSSVKAKGGSIHHEK